MTAARRIQSQRFRRTAIHNNAQMDSRRLRKYAAVDSGSRRLLEAAVNQLGLSAQAYNRILKIARTVADLAASEVVRYRSLDRREPAG